MTRNHRPSSTRIRPKSAETGASTAEFAVLLPTVVLVLAILVNAAAIGIQQVRMQDAAGIAARELARGESGPTVTGTAQHIAGNSVKVSTNTTSEWATVELTAPPPGVAGWFPGWTLSAQAQAPNQWAVTP